MPDALPLARPALCPNSFAESENLIMSEKRISRRDFLRASLAAGTAASIAAMPAGLTYAQEQAFLNYWTGWSGFEFDALQALVDQFNEEHDNSYVNMTTVFGQYEKVLTAIAGGNPPDVVSAVWLHQLVQIASQGALTPLTAYAEAAGIDGSANISRSYGKTGGTTANSGG